MRRTRTYRLPLTFILLGMLLVLNPMVGFAAQQYQGLCARVKIEILQELTLVRIGFLATLEITNNEVDADLTNFSAFLTFENESGEEASELFFVQPPELVNINALNGAGIIPPSKTAVIRWFIIPKIAAGGSDATGVRYQVGVNLAGAIYGQEIAPEVLQAIPDIITVKPEPQLEITYFQPRDVDGDDPFTADIVESPIPFTLGVLVKNSGYGRANDVKIASEQPRIVENKDGLLLIAQLLGSRVDDATTDETSLTVNLGDIEPERCRKGAWDMITSLSGEFVEFKASFTHASELGGEETSVITSMDAYFISHEVMNDQPGRDSLLDFLADTDNDAEHVPDTLYESDCMVLPVNTLHDVTAAGDTSGAIVTANADREGWVYMRMDDPGQAKYPIIGVMRSDGKLLNPNNYWTNIRYAHGTNEKLTYLNVFDFVALGDYQYIVTYGTTGDDSTPPDTTIRFSGEVQAFDGKFHILPATQIYFTVEDDSAVATYYKLDGATDFVPAYPFSITDGGEHSLEYYSRDDTGNTEKTKTVTVVVPTGYPTIAAYDLDQGSIYVSGDGLSVRPKQVVINFQGSTTAGAVNADVEVFQGVIGWPTLSGVPYSPTRQSGAVLTVGGTHVDYYKYRLGQGSWSAEIPIATLIELTDLPTGQVELTVNGRSEYGDFLPEDKVLTVFWDVDPDAPSTLISGMPTTPTAEKEVSLQVSGVDQYRYSVDGWYYHAAADISQAAILTDLSEGPHTVAVIGQTGAEPWQEQEHATTVKWTVNHLYGTDLSLIERVRHEHFENVADSVINYQWDGRDDDGRVLPEGWYTVRLTLVDALGQQSASVKAVRIDNAVANASVVAAVGTAAQIDPDAAGKWVVWQDQRNGNWDIFAQDLGDALAAPVSISTNSRSQEHPQTDGRLVVWEDRQSDGNWDIRAKDLNDSAEAFSITATGDEDERHPVVFWPWVVYRSRAITDPSAPWQLQVYNLVNGSTTAADPTTQDQLDPSIHQGRLVWQDFRNPGVGDIYFKDLTTGVVRPITSDTPGQYYPTVCDQWIVWSDKRHLQNELYGYNLLRNSEIRLTDTPENETRPKLNGKWLIYEEDSSGALQTNLRLLHLANLASIQLTQSESLKKSPQMAAGKIIWQDEESGTGRVMIGEMPLMQPVYRNRNAVAVTAGMVTHMPNAYALLELWNHQAGVTAVTRFTSLTPAVVSETVQWVDGQPSGTNFPLEEGTFLWVYFNQTRIVDLSQDGCIPLILNAGVNVFSFSCYPDRYSAFSLIRNIGAANVTAVRMLDSRTGNWRTASVVDGSIVGEDFDIPKVAVLMLDMKAAISDWHPGD